MTDADDGEGEVPLRGYGAQLLLRLPHGDVVLVAEEASLCLAHADARKHLKSTDSKFP